MPSDLDHRFDEMLAKVTGPGGKIELGRDSQGRAIVTNLPGTLPALFSTFCRIYGEREALITGEERLSFTDLDRVSDAVALGLAAKGVGKGERVAIAMRNCPSWVVTYMAVVKAGAIAALLNGWWQSRELAHAVELTEPKLIIADFERARRIEQPGSDCELVQLAIDLPIEQALGCLLASEGAPLHEVAPEEDATILFTSGSTGESKGALSTHRAVTTATYAYATGLMTLLNLLTNDGRAPETPPRTLLSVPLFHVTGEVPVMLNSFVIGRCMVVMPKWDAGEALRLIEKEKITYFVGVPTMSLELMNHPDRDRYDLSSLKDITGGGAPRPISHVERLQGAFPGAQPALGYGLTETNAVGCSNFWSSYAAKPESTGRPQRPFVEIAIMTVDGSHLPPKELGEIAIRSAANIRGYWRNDEATAATFTADGYVRTGDLGYLDEDGYLFITDRKKEIIIRGGENISAAEVEAACYACAEVAEATVFGVSDERLGEVPLAIVHVRKESALTERQLRAFLDERLARFKVPDRIIMSKEPLPRLGTGKIDRLALKTRHGR